MVEERLVREAPELDSGEIDIEIQQCPPAGNIFEYSDRTDTTVCQNRCCTNTACSVFFWGQRMRT